MIIWAIIGRILGYLTWPLVGLVIRFTMRTKVLIVCGDQVLLLKGWLGVGKWDLPGGGLRRRERPKRGALRELREEVGLDLRPKDLKELGVLTQTKGHRYNFHTFAVDVDEKPKLKLRKSEIVDAMWVPINEIESLRRSQALDLVIEAWQKQR